jgi:hypothetical protein
MTIEDTENEEKKYNIGKSILKYNGILSNVVFFSNNGILESYNNESNTEFKHNYFLLQALGLKTHPTKLNPFASPIESCGVNSCTHFTVPTPKFKELLTQAHIKGCIHGHKPFCGTVPLIFKDGDFVEIACDTSNGNRPKQFNKKDVELHQVPLAIVYKDGAGITSIYNDGTLSNKNTLGLSNDGKNNDFEPMIKYFPFVTQDYPTLTENKDFPTLTADENKDMKLIQYPEGGFQLNGHGNTLPTMYIASTFRPNKPKKVEEEAKKAVGGKRKTRRHKITKNKNKRNKKGKTLRNKRRTIRKR